MDMPPSIRPATPHDLPGIVSLLTRDAQERRSLDPLLWRLAANAPAQVEAAVGAALNSSVASARGLWFVAEHSGRIVGVTHAMMVPVPPIYDGAAGLPGLLLDDCFTSAGAPSGTAEALLVATEAALRTAGASALIASCPAAGPLRPLYERHGYEPVTLYMAKHRFSPDALPLRVRSAGAEDVPGIVKLSAEHRKTLAKVNPRFWRIHPEADSRFDAWMRRSLTLKDRDMRVAGVPGEVHGYVIAQPCSPLLIPIAHDVAAIGVIDDFYDEEFASVSAVSNCGSSGEDLLAAAESAFAQRGVESALVVCPAAWPSKISLLERRGFLTAKLWMLKR
jgi:predicted N-acetyltransferase YhbS